MSDKIKNFDELFPDRSWNQGIRDGIRNVLQQKLSEIKNMASSDFLPPRDACVKVIKELGDRLL